MIGDTHRLRNKMGGWDWRITDTGELHREREPARTYGRDCEEWWYKGNIHRTDGPAVIGPGDKVSWYVNDVRMTSFGEFQLATGCSDAHITFLKLKYGEIKF